MVIAFFDFDGTITRGDSFALFLKFLLGKRFYLMVAKNLHILLLYKMGLISNHNAKQSVLYSCICGMEERFLLQKCEDFVDLLESYCKDSAIKKIQWHQENNHEIVLVSASFEEYLRPLCNKWGIKLLATTMGVKNGIMTGRLDKPNCYGKQKEIRIKEMYDLDKYDSIYVYGDTIGDREMLKLASKDQAFYRIFN